MNKFGKQTLVSLIAGIISIFLTYFLFMGPIERLNIDVLNYFFPSKASTSDVVIIGIDEESFSAFDKQWPWPREFHAALTDRLVEEGAEKIIFDVIFSEPSNQDSDEAFATSIRNAGNVTLGSDISETKGGFISGVIETRPLKLFEDAGAKVGLAGVDMDNDLVVRYIPSYENTLSSVNTKFNETPLDRSKIIKYAGPDHFFKYISYYQFFVEDGIEKNSLKGKTVLIGLDLKANPDVQGGKTDTFPTPYTRFNSRVSPGVEIHANIYHNLVNQNWVDNPLWIHKAIIFGIMFLISLFGTANFKPLRSFGIGMGAHLVGFSICIWSWGEGYFLSIFLSFPTFLLMYGASSVHAFMTEGKQKRMIKGAFAQYLAPDMVDALIADPEKLQLGGEKRIMTIMFCDVRGFTAISEALKSTPEILTEVINTLLTELSEDILNCGGTIDKYMGDCIMAFWNAPIENPKHAELAVDAAKRMMKTIYKVNDKIQSERPNIPPLRIGIGIGTGECVVGNMGSNQRFDYTVLGDVVNLSSRLEGQTKGYGVATILCKNTAAKVSELTTEVLEIDKIRVKGKTEPETIFGLLENPSAKESIKKVEEYLVNFRNGELEKAEQNLKYIPKENESLSSFSELMLSRLNDLKSKGLPKDWDGVYTAETK